MSTAKQRRHRFVGLAIVATVASLLAAIHIGLGMFLLTHWTWSLGVLIAAAAAKVIVVLVVRQRRRAGRPGHRRGNTSAHPVRPERKPSRDA
ncbi:MULTISPECIES: hypothetical protein [Mycobacteriaceae]|uniref:hypothetical protein n=1 Tax=Mycobacteriaceae TaxID=1762 RepID=UPI001CD9928B|nr:hypothetical protein [Mycobacterium sp. WUMAC-067]MCA2243385.1 hypothetical protein [Mycobacterium sp. WUMAC-067]